MGADAVKVAQAADYTNAGTVEFLLDESKHYYFLEMNTRIQVEHPVTEMTTGTDLVVEQIRIAAGKKLSDEFSNLSQRGHAIECRIYAEDGENNFMPSIGKLLLYSEPSGPGIRVDSGVEQGSEVTIDYDPIMAKLIVHAPDRETAIAKMIDALNNYKLLGVKSSKRFMIEAMSHPEFVAGNTFTNFIEQHMTDRSDDRESFELAAAAAASVAGGGHGNSDETVGRSRIATPWNSIGSWEIGGRISE
jgi:acetyl/propionyl-CoA carboxylase alpha subunit